MTISKMIRHKNHPVRFLLLTMLCLSQLLYPAFAAQKNGDTQNTKKSEIKPNIGRMGEPIGVDPDEFKFSPAETKIWLNNHLENVSRPARLYYEFVKEGTFEEGFTDAVYLDIVEINEDGSKNAVLEFFTADRRQSANADNLTHITGNPVIGVYMQGDVAEMNRLTDGHWRYFKRKIKFAISDNANIEDVSFEYNGKMVEGEKITITPYVKDPRRNQFSKFADKRYEFIFSKQIPGNLYQIRSVVPDKSNPDKLPLIEETLTLQNVEFHG